MHRIDARLQLRLDTHTQVNFGILARKSEKNSTDLFNTCKKNAKQKNKRFILISHLFSILSQWYLSHLLKCASNKMLNCSWFCQTVRSNTTSAVWNNTSSQHEDPQSVGGGMMGLWVLSSKWSLPLSAKSFIWTSQCCLFSTQNKCCLCFLLFLINTTEHLHRWIVYFLFQFVPRHVSTESVEMMLQFPSVQ